jgi:hypothetical protein
MRLFSESGVVERAFETASTFEGSFEASLGGSLGLFVGGLVEYADIFCWDGRVRNRLRVLCDDSVARVANVRAEGRDSRSDHLAAGSIFTSFSSDVSGVYVFYDLVVNRTCQLRGVTGQILVSTKYSSCVKKMDHLRFQQLRHCRLDASRMRS